MVVPRLRISEMVQADLPLDGSERLAIDQGGLPRQASAQAIADRVRVEYDATFVEESTFLQAIQGVVAESRMSPRRVADAIQFQVPVLLPENTQPEAIAGTASAGRMTPRRVRDSIESMLWSVNNGVANRSLKQRAGDFINVHEMGAVGDGVTDDTDAIQYCLDNFTFTIFKPGLVYLITRALTISVSNRYIIGNNATLYGLGADFDNTTTDFLASNAAFIQIKGQLVTPFNPIGNVSIDRLRLQSQNVIGRKVDGIVVQNCVQVTIDRCEIFDFPAAIGIRANSLRGGKFRRNTIRDFYDDTNWTALSLAQPNLTGIEFDGARTNGVSSSDIEVAGNRITNMIVGPVFLAAHGNQTDGLTSGQATEAEIHHNYIENVAEGIDWWGNYTTISNNFVRDCDHWCIALKHGFSHGHVIDNVLLEATLGHISIQPNGSTGTFKNSDGIVIRGNYCLGLRDSTGSPLGIARTCIHLVDSVGSGGTAVVSNTLIEGNICRPNGNGDYSIVYATTGSNNDIIWNSTNPGVTGEYVVVTGTPRTYIPNELRTGGAILPYKRFGSKTFDPVSSGAGTSQTTTVTVTGAALGDVCGASFSQDMQSVLLFAYVSAADTVACVFYNWTAGTVDLASGTLTAWAMR